MLILSKKKVKEAFETKPYPFTVTERTHQEFPNVVKELGWIFNLHNRTYTHYFDSFCDFIQYALFIYGEVRVV